MKITVPFIEDNIEKTGIGTQFFLTL